MFDLLALQAAVAREGRVARVVIARHDGSSPREVGASMLVWPSGQSGTIGGGTLEWEAIARARKMLARAEMRPSLEREALGPKLGQCCGGAVTVLTEIYDQAALETLKGQSVIARPIDSPEMPLKVKRLLAEARAKGLSPASQFLQGWMIEPLAQPKRHIWIWGAGHVGRALVGAIAPLPDLALTWIDTSRARFPETIPAGITPIWTENPEVLADHAPPAAEHLIVTYSHALDLELCHRLLRRQFKGLGLIGSATKWARFRSRLAGLGHKPDEVDRITCPIGDPSLGKHPQAIALGVAVQLIKFQSETEIADDDRDGKNQRQQPLEHRRAHQSLSRGRGQ